MRDIIGNTFKCPVCGGRMSVSDGGKSAVCDGANPKSRKHSFDFSADGYLSFGLTGGDSKAAVAARKAFLRETGAYEKAALAIKDAVERYLPHCRLIVDAGCGEGYYTSMLSEVAENALGFDLSKFACSAGAKQAKKDGKDNLLFATASVFELPLTDGCADAVTNIFAPCAEDEYARILKNGGCLFVVGAGKEHLMGLKKAIYDDVYENGQRKDLPKNLKHIACETVSYEIEVVGKDNIAALFSMTPYYWRTTEADKDKLMLLESLTTTVEFEINIYRKEND